jgi:hypothetical protein
MSHSIRFRCEPVLARCRFSPCLVPRSAGNPINVSARATSPTTIELGWVNRASEGYLPYGIFGIPYSGDPDVVRRRGVPLAWGDLLRRQCQGGLAGRTRGRPRTAPASGRSRPCAARTWTSSSPNSQSQACNELLLQHAEPAPKAGTQGCVSPSGRPSGRARARRRFRSSPSRRPSFPIPDVDPGVLKRPTRAATAAIRPTACKIGYVWRVARPSDLACVTPESREPRRRRKPQRVLAGSAGRGRLRSPNTLSGRFRLARSVRRWTWCA